MFKLRFRHAKTNHKSHIVEHVVWALLLLVVGKMLGVGDCIEILPITSSGKKDMMNLWFVLVRCNRN